MGKAAGVLGSNAGVLGSNAGFLGSNPGVLGSSTVEVTTAGDVIGVNAAMAAVNIRILLKLKIISRINLLSLTAHRLSEAPCSTNKKLVANFFLCTRYY